VSLSDGGGSVNPGSQQVGRQHLLLQLVLPQKEYYVKHETWPIGRRSVVELRSRTRRRAENAANEAFRPGILKPLLAR
jgi:hypothetical protein